MNKNLVRTLIRGTRFASAAVLLAATLSAATAEAQYYGGQPRPGSYYGPRPQPRWGHRHRFHPYVGGQLSGLVIINQSTDEVEWMGHGGGAGLFAGLRLGPFFSLETNWILTFHDEQTGNSVFLDNLYLSTWTVDAKIHIPSRGPVEPFIQAGVGYAYLGATYGDGFCDRFSCDTTFAKGPTFALGGGLDVWLSPFLTLGGRVLYRASYFDEYAAGQFSSFISGVGIDLNAAFHF